VDSFLSENCTFSALGKLNSEYRDSFSCGHDDIDDFFKNDFQSYSEQMLGKSYCFYSDSVENQIVCAFTISNDSIKVHLLPNARKKNVSKSLPYEKRHLKTFPAVLIGRLGVNTELKNKGIGHELMDFIKAWFVNPNNKTGCRFIVVDSYNEEKPLSFYSKNGFKFLFSTEAQEIEYMGLPEKSILDTRLMYFDLIILNSNEPNM
jgi:hypothetical protein